MDDGDDWFDDDNQQWFAMGYFCGLDEKPRTPAEEKSENLSFAFVILALIVGAVCVVLHALTDSMPFAVLVGILGFILDVFACRWLSKA